jgi:hypothetical protein
MQYKQVSVAPAGEKWIFEIKFDGYPLHCREARERGINSSLRFIFTPLIY